jgi:hypothetical protein
MMKQSLLISVLAMMLSASTCLAIEFEIPLSNPISGGTKVVEIKGKKIGYDLGESRKAAFLLSLEEGRLYSVVSRPSPDYSVEIIGFGSTDMPVEMYTTGKQGACKLGEGASVPFAAAFTSVMKDVRICQDKCCGKDATDISCRGNAMAAWQDGECTLFCSCNEAVPVRATE